MKTKAILASILALGAIFFLQGICVADICSISGQEAGCVKAVDIANRAIRARHIKARAILTGKIKDGAVTSAKIADGAVTSAKLADPIYTQAEVDAMISNLQAQITELQAGLPLETVCIECCHTIGPNAGECYIVPFEFVRIRNNIYFVIFSGEDNLVQGTAELKGNIMSFSMTDSGWFGSDSVYVMMSYAELNMDTKEGTFRGIDFDAWPSGGEPGEYFAGTLAIVQCPSEFLVFEEGRRELKEELQLAD